MDDRLQRLQRKAAGGDSAALQELAELRIRLGLCAIHGVAPKGYDPITNKPDPAGWGTGCPECEKLIWCGTKTCKLVSCHQCNPDFDCEFGHQICIELYRNLSFIGVDEPPEPAEEDEEDDPDEDDGRWDCPDCQGTGIGYPVDRSCRVCGGSGIRRQSR